MCPWTAVSGRSGSSARCWCWTEAGAQPDRDQDLVALGQVVRPAVRGAVGAARAQAARGDPGVPQGVFAGDRGLGPDLDPGCQSVGGGVAHLDDVAVLLDVDRAALRRVGSRPGVVPTATVRRGTRRRGRRAGRRPATRVAVARARAAILCASRFSLGVDVTVHDQAPWMKPRHDSASQGRGQGVDPMQAVVVDLLEGGPDHEDGQLMSGEGRIYRFSLFYDWRPEARCRGAYFHNWTDITETWQSGPLVFSNSRRPPMDVPPLGLTSPRDINVAGRQRTGPTGRGPGNGREHGFGQATRSGIDSESGAHSLDRSVPGREAGGLVEAECGARSRRNPACFAGRAEQPQQHRTAVQAQPHDRSSCSDVAGWW